MSRVAPRFTLTTLLGIITLIAVWSAFHGNRGRYERRIEQQVIAAGGRVGSSRVIGLDGKLLPPGIHERLLTAVFGQRFIRWVEFNNMAMSAECLDGVMRLPHLESLSIRECGIGPDHLKSLDRAAGLRTLDLCFNAISDEHLKGINALRRLRDVNLAGTQCGDPTLKRLSDLPHLVSISLGNTNITGEGVAHFQCRASLIRFSAEASTINDRFLATLATCPNLEELYLTGTKSITDQGVACFRGHPNLRFIGLTSVPLTDASLQSLADLPRLKRLQMNANALTYEAKQDFRKQRPDVDY